ncbi:formylmethanofuran dehydrogenase subunit A [bacterium]|nr:formylmethanofuran dehydrogenase subunit A [bacterium]
MGAIVLKGATLYDPSHEGGAQRRDLWIDRGKIVRPGSVKKVDRTFDLTGDIVMPGGVEMHCHIVGPKVNLGRRFFPEFDPDDRMGPIHGTRATGRLFAGIGTTTAVDAAIPPLLARHAHLEMTDTPLIDKACYLLFDNNHFVLDALRENRLSELDAYLGWTLSAARGYGIKLVNPGGIENWKQISRKTLHELEEPVPGFGVSPHTIVRGLAAAADRLKLRHSVHIHCNNLGVPGNVQTTLSTMKALDGARGHFAHIQFHSYGGSPDDPTSFCSAVPQLIEYVREHPNISVDVGHIHPGRALSMTGDAPFSQVLHQLTGGRWYAADAEQESSCGVLPIEYRPQKSLVHAVQWAIGLEWYLLMPDPWRLAMTSDHPNGGAFTRYPEMIELLMSRDARQEAMSRMPADLKSRTHLAEIDREYTLEEIAIITRGAPARLLGLDSKGHLGVGADADIAVYRPSSDHVRMFGEPRYVFKAGQLVAENGVIRAEPLGQTFTMNTGFDDGVVPRIKDWFEKSYSIQFSHYSLREEDFPPAVPLAGR